MINPHRTELWIEVNLLIYVISKTFIADPGRKGANNVPKGSFIYPSIKFGIFIK
jgi:hypothetical protein